MSSGDAVNRTRRLFLSWGKPAVRSTFVQSSFHFSFFYVRDLFFFPELRPRCRVKQLSVTRAVITRLNLDKSESEQLVSESQRSERCLFFCLRARWKDAAMLLGADSRVCLAGGRAQSVLHFTQQQTGEKVGGKEARDWAGTEENGETEAGTKSTEDSFSCAIMISNSGSAVERTFYQLQSWAGQTASEQTLTAGLQKS